MAAKSGKDGNEERRARLAAALRANLHRRKAQARSRRDDKKDDLEPQKRKDRAR